MKLSRAIVRPPAPTFAAGLTTVHLGAPDIGLALQQHARYCAALEQCGLELTHLDPEPAYPDSTFVEDTAVLTPHAAVLTNPGAPSRNGEVAGIAKALTNFYARVRRISAPGTVDGGDICQADNHFFIGISKRTNAQGAEQLAAFLAEDGFTSSFVDIAAMDVEGLLHLKSGISYLGENRIALIAPLVGHTAFRDYEIIPITEAEAYAANFLRINGRVILAAGYPHFEAQVRAFGYPVIALDMSEFRKMDGALSCLSLRF